MAYDDSAYRQRDNGSGVRNDADYRSPSYGGGDYRDDTLSDSLLNSAQAQPRRVPAEVLGNVFDDPMHGEPGRDRLAVHVVWEFVLLLAAGGLAFLLYRRDADLLRGEELKTLLLAAAALGLLTIGAGLSLRAGAVNLAIGPLAVAAGLHFAEHGDDGLVLAAGAAMAGAAVLGLLVALLVVGLHVPGWAASLAGALAVIVFIRPRTAPVNPQGDFDPRPRALYLFGAVAALAVIGGLFGAIKPIRRTVGRFRPVVDPARRRGGVAALMTGGAIVLSSVFAAAGGVLTVAGQGLPVVPSPGLELTGLALGAALLGGTSAFGRRGGVLGTLLAVVLVTLFIRYAAVQDWRIAPLAIAAGAVAGGLLVTRIVELFGRPPAARRAADWNTGPSGAETVTPAWAAEQRAAEWSPPAAQAGARGDAWESDRWGTSGR